MKKTTIGFLVFVTAALCVWTSCKKDKETEKNLTDKEISTAVVANDTNDEYYTYSEPMEKYVCTDDGSNLNYRESPLDGNKLGKFPNGTRLTISKRTNKKYEIDGILDYWYYGLSVVDKKQVGGWVFGGYLEDSKIYSQLIKEWDSDRHILKISQNGEIAFLLKESEGAFGTWSLLKGNILLFHFTPGYDGDGFPNKLQDWKWQIKYIDDNKLVFDWSGREYVFYNRPINQYLD